MARTIHVATHFGDAGATLGRMNDVLVIGNCAVDILVGPLDDWPAPGGTRALNEMTIASGGCALNVAAALGRLGVGADLVTRVGADQFGKFLLDELEACEVDTSGVVVDPDAATPMTIVTISTDGQRSFLHHRGTNDRIRRTDVLRVPLERRRYVIVSGAMVMAGLDGEPTAEVLAAAKLAGVTTLLDTVFVDDRSTEQWCKLLDPVLPHVDIFCPSLEEGRRITNQTEAVDVVRALIDKGARSVALKVGEHGAFVKDRDGRESHVAGFPARPVDTTGAGDCFCAGLIAGLRRGGSLAEAARIGNAVARRSVLSTGATDGVPRLDDVLEMLPPSTEAPPRA